MDNMEYVKLIVESEKKKVHGVVSSSSSQVEDGYKLTHKEIKLIRYYRKYWLKTQTKFCKKYGVNQGVFSQFTRGRRESPKSKNTLKQFYNEHHNNPELFKKKNTKNNHKTKPIFF